jgi:hypothetical protein
MANNYGVGGQVNYQLDYDKIAADSQKTAKKPFPDPAKVFFNNAGKAIGGVWNRLVNPTPPPPAAMPAVNIPVKPPPIPPTPEEWEALKVVAPGDRAQMLELLRATSGQQK